MKKLRALVVDDNALARNAVARALSSEIDIVHAADGETALDMIRERNDFDVFFLDVALGGGMTGVDLLHEAVSVRPHVPRALVTGCLEPWVVNAALACDAELVAKPFSVRDLLVLVRRLRAKRMAAPDVVAAVAALARAWRLSPAERRVFVARASGKPEAGICSELGIARSTYDTRVRAILHKAALAGHEFRDMGRLVEALLRGEILRSIA